MARKSRIDDPEALHHFIARGIEHRSIFVDAPDYQSFLERLGNILGDEIKSQGLRRVVARSRAEISIAAIEQIGNSGAETARALNLTPSAISKLVLRARNDPTLKNGVKDVLNLF